MLKYFSFSKGGVENWKVKDNNKRRVRKYLPEFSFQRGFTLIEIILVITLIGIMATLLISLVNPAYQFQKSNDARRKADLHQIQGVLELYRTDQATYPAALPNCGTPLVGGTTTYLQKVPCDPKNTGDFQYKYVLINSNTYSLIACLENVGDSQKDATNDTVHCTGGSTDWSYTVTNP